MLAETPLEALVFRYTATGGASLLTWLAVLAAALGLWRILAAAAPRAEPAPRSGRHATSAHGEPGCDVLPQAKATPQEQRRPEAEARPPNPSVDSGSVGFARKGAVFANRDWRVGEEEDKDDGGVEEEEEVVEEEEKCPWNGEGGGVIGGCMDCAWRGDLGWYRYQDLAALNGRVVRLWEDEQRVARRQH